MIEMPYRTLWLDIETTGIDPDTEQVLEIGLVACNERLDVLAAKSICVKHDAPAVPDDFVQEMHTENMLWGDVETRGLDPMLAAIEAEAFARLWVGNTDDTLPLIAAGSGIDRFDIPFLQRMAPNLTDLFHFRTIDVSGAKTLLGDVAGVTSERYYNRRMFLNHVWDGAAWGPDVPHRGVADALDALYSARAIADLMRQGAR